MGLAIGRHRGGGLATSLAQQDSLARGGWACALTLAVCGSSAPDAIRVPLPRCADPHRGRPPNRPRSSPGGRAHRPPSGARLCAPADRWWPHPRIGHLGRMNTRLIRTHRTSGKDHAMEMAAGFVASDLETLREPPTPAVDRMVTVIATYQLSENGRKALLVAGGDGRGMQKVTMDVPASRLHLVTVDHDGVARLKLRPQ